jgi:hypothetical protein
MSLQQILKEKPEKKELISKNLIELVKNCMKKDIINLDLVHTALLQALEISSPHDIEVCITNSKLTVGIGFPIQRTVASIGPY